MDMLYDFYNKHKMHAVECKLYAMINKNKVLINKFNNIWRHLLNRKIEITVFDYYNLKIYLNDI